MIKESPIGQDHTSPSRTTSVPRQSMSGRREFGLVRNDRGSSHTTTDFSSGGKPPEHVLESAQLMSSENAQTVRSMLDIGDENAGIQARRNGLSLREGMLFDSWREVGRQVTLVANCSAWWLGDWLVYGEQAYGDRYKQAIVDTSMSYQTLRNYAWVARTFPASRRQDNLSFGHHAEVAALPSDEQDMWLARADQLNWSCNKLRRALHAAKLANRQAARELGADDTRALKIDVPAERHDRWQSAAERKNRSIADWIIEALDFAASEDLNIEPPQR